MSAVMTKPLFVQNVLGLKLVLCKAIIAGFFPWLHVERFQSTEVRQCCLGLRVIGRSVGMYMSCCRCCSLHIVIKLRHKTCLSDFPLKC